MRTWQRTKADKFCGRCADFLPKGAPVQVVTIPGVQRVSLRCAACADEPVGVLPPLSAPASGFSRMTRAALVQALPFDLREEAS